MAKGKNKGKGPPKKKVKVVKPTIRHTYTVEQKNFARVLKKEGKEPKEIIKSFKEKYGLEPKPSTMSTWYNEKNMAMHELMASRNTSMASVETHVNPAQRATILLDTEYALLGMIKKGNIIGTTTLRKSLQNMGKAIFDKLRASNIYDGPGRRRRSLSVLNVVQMNKLLEYISEDRILCPICKTPVTSVSDDSLNVHLQSHLNPDDEQMTSPPGGETFSFEGSDGWVRNFLRRHKPVFNQLETHKEHRNECSTEIEQFETDSSSDNENSVDTHKGSDVELDTQSDVQSERNINEIKGNHFDAMYECFVRLIQLETSNIFNKSSTVDQHKIHDFELDEHLIAEVYGNYEPSDVELNEQSVGELDIDGIRNHLNTLPCTPGGECFCDTDFTSQIPEYINDYFDESPHNTIFIVHDGRTHKFIVSEDEDFQA